MKDEYKTGKDSSEFDYEDDENAEDEDDKEQDSEKQVHHEGVRLLTYIQIFGSIAILAAALAIRVFNTDLYNMVRTWYLTAVNDSIIADEQMDQAKRTVIGLWNNISSAGPQSQVSSQAESSQGPQSSQSAQSSQAAAGSQRTVSSQAAQSTKPASSASTKAPGNNQQVSP